ncbi:hypothetical protein [Nocardioides sp. Leaf285]|uniref:hypothetical protein n=1 Tax=Nocardioides sp. Leaf285 TaxID=1736322 RepID=UPI000702FED3|nr:hypothetical protein [Nocardioides sp. Leaf285]KQP62976.1 hypothetical protein ASF47_18360 [Nocardioides sp. Leaf285]
MESTEQQMEQRAGDPAQQGAPAGSLDGGDVPLPGFPAAPASAKATPKTKRGIESRGKKSGMPISATSVSVPASIAAAWKDRARRDGANHVDVMLTAVAQQRALLPDLVREHQRQQRPSVGPSPDGVFVQRVEPKPEEPFVAVPLRMLSANVDILDGLVHEAGANSRSALVTAALASWLRPQAADSRAS